MRRFGEAVGGESHLAAAAADGGRVAATEVPVDEHTHFDGHHAVFPGDLRVVHDHIVLGATADGDMHGAEGAPVFTVPSTTRPILMRVPAAGSRRGGRGFRTAIVEKLQQQLVLHCLGTLGLRNGVCVESTIFAGSPK